MLKKSAYLVSFVLILFFACRNQEENKYNNQLLNLSKKERFEISQNSLKKALEKEHAQINSYIKRMGGEFSESKTGVRTYIVNKVLASKKAQAGNIVEIIYSTQLLNGTVLKKAGTHEKFMLEYSEKESGLHEAIKNINIGEEAIIIIPSHRAHGLVGDDDQIPALSTLVYNLKLIGIE